MIQAIIDTQKGKVLTIFEQLLFFTEKVGPSLIFRKYRQQLNRREDPKVYQVIVSSNSGKSKKNYSFV